MSSMKIIFFNRLFYKKTEKYSMKKRNTHTGPHLTGGGGKAGKLPRGGKFWKKSVEIF